MGRQLNMTQIIKLKAILNSFLEKFHHLDISRRQLIIGSALALLFGLFVYVVLTSGPLSPTKVTTIKISSQALTPTLFGVGTVEARRSYLMGPVIAGRVFKVHVDVGHSVKEGQLLAEMDSIDLNERMVAVQAQVNDAKARMVLASETARRYVELGKKNFISPIVVEGKIQELDSAKAVVQKTNADLAGLKQQELNLKLKAPIDGMITSRDAEPGSTVIAGQAVLKMIDPTSLWIKTRFDQGKSMGLSLGLNANIILRSNPHHPISGKVVRVEMLSDSVAEERIAQIEMTNTPKSISIGEMAEVTLQLAPSESTLSLPNVSIKQKGSATGVWLLQNGKPHFAPVQIGQIGLNGNIAILSGLKSGDEVILYSDTEIKEGVRIKVVDSLVKKLP
ncbi:efflux RND transporter periplasmic adaptor subunit [Polynucleobacter sp. JS-Mosq-20-D10]|uniref:efflux RND transporter periplasmic adaptor subunit n=1 Tax=Polynucleobacter sp. JS-Mosq-20-D10 TaxID=2576922 RepID=UPI002040F209|nr:efflux RND transporter periplasmic adaptor subunit [Polynucleobacter sp. JS-Mosq-20-D10]